MIWKKVEHIKILAEHKKYTKAISYTCKECKYVTKNMMVIIIIIIVIMLGLFYSTYFPGHTRFDPIRKFQVLFEILNKTCQKIGVFGPQNSWFLSVFGAI
jgi:hypothetical protein